MEWANERSYGCIHVPHRLGNELLRVFNHSIEIIVFVSTQISRFWWNKFQWNILLLSSYSRYSSRRPVPAFPWRFASMVLPICSS
jgi:hypothetical protein